MNSRSIVPHGSGPVIMDQSQIRTYSGHSCVSQ